MEGIPIGTQLMIYVTRIKIDFQCVYVCFQLLKNQAN